MFGYIKVYQPELKMGEFEQYRGIYCSLCRNLGKRYGFVAQMTLNYDVTFLAVLHMALSEDCPGFHPGRCPYNPLKKRTCCGHTQALDFCADVAMLLNYHKTADTIADERFIKRLFARIVFPIMRRNRRRAAKRLPEIDALIEIEMKNQRVLEQARTNSVDKAAEPTAHILSALCEAIAPDETQKQALSRLGYCLGRWVYLIDAADDLEKDIQTSSYNAFALSSGLTKTDQDRLKEIKQSALFSLNASLAECRAAYDQLSIRRFDGILRNVWEWGIPSIQKQVLSGENKKCRQGGFKNAKSV